MRITVCGTGYVGLVAAVVFAHKGHQVVGFDVNEDKIAVLKSGCSPLFEPGLEELLRANAERLEFTTDAAVAYEHADIIFIAVPTPERADGSAELSYVWQVCDQMLEYRSAGCPLVVKSTVPPGTNDRIQRFLDKRAEITGVEFEVVSNPEFLSQGTAVRDMLEPSRIVVGTRSEAAAELMRSLYEPFDSPLMIMDVCSAELVKYASNDFLALKISYINEIANLCSVLGADIEQVAAGMGADPRIGSQFLRAGIGYGGSCFPKDTKALHWLSECQGREIKTIKATIEVNTAQKIALVRDLREQVGSLAGKRVAVLGLTFKPNTDDLRDAPSLEVVRELREEGAILALYDPHGINAFKQLHMEIPGLLEYFDDPRLALDGADAALLLTEWEQIATIEPSEYAARMSTPQVYDGRNMYDRAVFVGSGVRYASIGRPVVEA